MIEGMSGIPGQLASLGLDISLARHEWLAHNIANSSTPGFVGKDIDFGAVFKAAAASNGMGNPFENTLAAKEDFSRLREDLENGSFVTERLGNPVEVDNELVEITANELHYQAILSAMGKRGAILGMAVNGGRG